MVRMVWKWHKGCYCSSSRGFEANMATTTVLGIEQASRQPNRLVANSIASCFLIIARPSTACLLNNEQMSEQVNNC